MVRLIWIIPIFEIIPILEIIPISANFDPLLLDLVTPLPFIKLAGFDEQPDEFLRHDMTCFNNKRLFLHKPHLNLINVNDLFMPVSN